MSDPQQEVIQAKKKRGCGFWILIAIGVFVGLAIIGSLLPEPTPEQKAAREAEQKAEEQAKREEAEKEAQAQRESATKVSAADLFNAYQNNEMAAQNAFGDRILEVSGIVDGVTLDITDDPVVQLQTSNQFMPVSVRLTDDTQEAAASYSKGQKVAFLCGDVSEVASMPQLRDCRPVD